MDFLRQKMKQLGLASAGRHGRRVTYHRAHTYFENSSSSDPCSNSPSDLSDNCDIWNDDTEEDDVAEDFNDKPSNQISSLRQSKIQMLFRRPLKIVYFANEGETYFDQSVFVQQCLKWHNYFRKLHNVSSLLLSKQLCSKAQSWANHLAHTETFCSNRKTKSDIGESLFCKWSPVVNFDITGEEVVRYWYSEISMYKFNQQPSLLHTHAGHFTQVVWKSSKHFGVGKARTRAGRIIVVANYYPPGNICGAFEQNVLPFKPGSRSDIAISVF